MILTTIWSLIMPPVKFSLYFYKEKDSTIIQTKINESTNVNLDKKNIKVCKIYFFLNNNMIFTVLLAI